MLLSNITEELFSSLSSGLLKRNFEKLEKYKNFLKDKDSIIKDIYIIDLCSRPGIITKEGINIIIFTSHSIACPFGQNVNDLYSFNKSTFLIYNSGSIYEPIYKLQYNNKLEIIYLHNSSEPIIYNIVDTSIKGCEPYDEIDWDKVAKIEKTEELTLKQTLEKINNKYKIVQIIDNYSKTTGIVLDNAIYIPVKPSMIDINYPYKKDDISILTFDKTISYLHSISKDTELPLKPVYLIEFNSTIVGILLETNRIIPIIPTKLSKLKTKLKIADFLYYPDIDSQEYDNSYKEKRIKSINEYKYNNEAFSRFKYEISRYIQNKPIKDKIINIIEQPNNSNKYSDLKKIMSNITSILIAKPNDSKKKIEKIIKNKYTSPLLRKPCFEDNKENDPHCICKGKKCKLVNIINTNFTERFIDILLRYPIQRNDILNGTISMIDLKSSLHKHQNGEILLNGNKLDEEFGKLFSNKEYIYLHLLKDIDILQPTFEGIDKKMYLKIKKGTEKNIKTYSIIEFTQHWSSIINPSFRFVSSLEASTSLYYIFSEISKKITDEYLKSYTKRVSYLEDITILNIKDMYSRFIIQMETLEIQNLAKKLNISSENIIDVSDIYNIYNEKNKIISVDELSERIKIGFPAYKPTKFDVIMMSYMLNINVILLRSSISEVFGTNFVDSGLYVVLYYEPYETENSTRFYLLQKNAILYITELNNTIKKLM